MRYRVIRVTGDFDAPVYGGGNEAELAEKVVEIAMKMLGLGDSSYTVEKKVAS